jgi:hypothetical protein
MGHRQILTFMLIPLSGKPVDTITNKESGSNHRLLHLQGISRDHDATLKSSLPQNEILATESYRHNHSILRFN